MMPRVASRFKRAERLRFDPSTARRYVRLVAQTPIQATMRTSTVPTFTPSRLALPAAACAFLALAPGCDLVETCDPELDPNCTVIDGGEFAPDGGTDAGTDTPVTGGCGTLGEGQARCTGAASMEICQSGTLNAVTCTNACRANACVDAVRYVRIVDVTGAITGQHPGADIDAVALQSGGQTIYATQITDSQIPPGVSNRATDVTEILGPPDVGPNQCDLTDGAEHWISLAGGEIVVTFDRPIQSGDRITVYECAGAAQDSFDVTIGVSDRLEGDWTVLLEEASGTVTVNVP